MKMFSGLIVCAMLASLALSATTVFSNTARLAAFDYGSGNLQSGFTEINVASGVTMGANGISLEVTGGTEYRTRADTAGDLPNAGAQLNLLKDFGFENDDTSVVFSLSGLSADTDYTITVYSYDADSSNNGQQSTWATNGDPVQYTRTLNNATLTGASFNITLTSTASGTATIEATRLNSLMVWNGFEILVPVAPAPSITNTTTSYLTHSTAGLAGLLDAQQTNMTVYAYWSTNEYDGQVQWEGGTAVSNTLVDTYTDVTNITVVADVENLLPETTYYYALVASNAVTNIWATPRGTFTTLQAPAPPTVTAGGGATEIGAGTASLRAELTAGGSADVFICWGAEAGDESSTSTWENVVSMDTLNEGDIVTNDISGLLYGIEYSYVVYATNSEGTNWSSAATFTTLEPSGWTPTDLASLQMWLDADDSSSITLGAGGVSNWVDKSSHGRHVAQLTTGSQPGYASSTVSFDGSDDYLWNSTPFMYENGEIDVFLVAAVSTGTDDRIIAEGRSTSNNPIYSFGTPNGNATQMGVFLRNDSGSIPINHVAVSAVSVFTGVSRIFQYRDTGTSVSGRVNGGTETSGNYSRSGTLTLDRFAIGGLLRGSLATPAAFGLNEIVVTDNLSSGDRELMEGYLAWKWGLESDLPTGHSYTNSNPRSTPIGIATTIAVPAPTSAELNGILDATQSVFTVYAAYSESNNTSTAEWEADDTKTLVLDAVYTNVMGQAISLPVGSLTPETTYYYTLLASNAVTNIWATPRVEFTTLASAVNPSVTTNDGAFAVGYTTASLRGEMTAGGSANIYICWGESAGNTTSTSSWANVDFMGALSDGAIVTNNLTGLAHSTEHHYVVYATNDADTAWSSIATFTTETPGDDRYATGTFTWSTSDNAWSFESGGPYNQPWEAGKNAILEGSGTVTLGENVSLTHLKINNNYTYITGNTLTFEAGGTITNLGNSVHILSCITGGPDVYVDQANGWSLGFGDDGFKFLPDGDPIALGTIRRGTDNYFNLGGSSTGNTIEEVILTGSNPWSTKALKNGSGTWTVGGEFYAGWLTVSDGTLISNGHLWENNNFNIDMNGGTLIVNGTVDADIDFTSGTLGGTAVVDSAVTVPAGATLAPGGPTGTMTITNNNCTISGTLAITMDDNTNPKVSTLMVDGTLDISAGTSTLDFDEVNIAVGTHIIATYTSLTGSFAVTNGLPRRSTIDYAYNSGSAIALIVENNSTVFRFR